MFMPDADPAAEALLATTNAMRAQAGLAPYGADGQVVSELSTDEQIAEAHQRGDVAASISLQQRRAAETSGETDFREIELIKENHRTALAAAHTAGDGREVMRLNEQHIIDLASATVDGPNGGRVNIEGPAAVLALIERQAAERAAYSFEVPWSEERKAQYAAQEKQRARRAAERTAV